MIANVYHSEIKKSFHQNTYIPAQLTLGIVNIHRRYLTNIFEMKFIPSKSTTGWNAVLLFFVQRIYLLWIVIHQTSEVWHCCMVVGGFIVEWKWGIGIFLKYFQGGEGYKFSYLFLRVCKGDGKHYFIAKSGRYCAP